VRLVREPATAEDLTIETFWRIYKSRGRFDTRLDFGAWAYRNRHQRCIEPSAAKTSAGPILNGDVPQATRANPAEQSEKRESIRSALLSLPPDFNWWRPWR